VSRSLRPGFALLAAPAVLALAGCGSDATPAAAGDTSLAAYRACLGKQGITLPSAPAGFAGRASGRPSSRPTAFPSGRPSGFPSGRPTSFPSGRPGRFGGMRPEGVDEQTWQKAQEACASVRPTAGAGVPGNRRGAGNRGADTAYRNCLADHGVTAPNARPSAEAERACAVLRPSANPQQTPSD